jgi:hypothetical protein
MESAKNKGNRCDETPQPDILEDRNFTRQTKARWGWALKRCMWAVRQADNAGSLTNLKEELLPGHAPGEGRAQQMARQPPLPDEPSFPCAASASARGRRGDPPTCSSHSGWLVLSKWLGPCRSDRTDGQTQTDRLMDGQTAGQTASGGRPLGIHNLQNPPAHALSANYLAFGTLPEAHPGWRLVLFVEVFRNVRAV